MKYVYCIMEITSKIYLENSVYISLSLKDCRLRYDFEYNNETYQEEPYDSFNLYKQSDTGNKRYKNIYYKKIQHSSITKNKLLSEGFYLFVFKRTKIFLNFLSNKIVYELENNDIEDEDFLS